MQQTSGDFPVSDVFTHARNSSGGVQRSSYKQQHQRVRQLDAYQLFFNILSCQQRLRRSRTVITATVVRLRHLLCTLCLFNPHLSPFFDTASTNKNNLLVSKRLVLMFLLNKHDLMNQIHSIVFLKIFLSDCCVSPDYAIRFQLHCNCFKGMKITKYD